MSRSHPPTTGSRPAAIRLSDLATGRRAHVHRVDPRAAGQSHERAQPLADIGFVPGEAVSVVTHAWPGGDPLVVRVGHSRFALRRAEAACIQVLPADE